MAKLIVRTLFLTILTCFTAVMAKAQVGYDYSQYDVGFSAGMNQFYGDVLTSKTTRGVSFNFDYNQTAYVNYIFEAQFGKLAGGDMNLDLTGRQFNADYNYYAVRFQLQGGEVIDYSQSKAANFFKNLYIGAGVGMIFNTITSINRYSVQVPGYYTPGVNKSKEFFIPARLGYEFKLYNKYQRPDVKIDIGYQYNFVYGDNLDGFRTGNLHDAFAQISLGVKFSLGGVTSYRKQVPY